MTSKFLLVSAAAAGALVAAGSASALSDYTYTDTIGGLQPEGTYAIDTNPHNIRTDGAWGSYLAPTGTGTFEIVNGAGDPTLRFFYETVSLTAGTPYVVAADIVNNYNQSPPVIQLTVDGSAVGASQALTGPYGEYQDPDNTVPAMPGPWIVHDFTYTPTVSGSHVIAFVDLNTEASGNDFSFDPATSGLAVPEPTTWALMLVGAAGLGGALRARRSGMTAAA